VCAQWWNAFAAMPLPLAHKMRASLLKIFQ
jgi:hypothetical protein